MVIAVGFGIRSRHVRRTKQVLYPAGSQHSFACFGQSLRPVEPSIRPQPKRKKEVTFPKQ
jgi:hypothetical protein